VGLFFFFFLFGGGFFLFSWFWLWGGGVFWGGSLGVFFFFFFWGEFFFWGSVFVMFFFSFFFFFFWLFFFFWGGLVFFLVLLSEFYANGPPFFLGDDRPGPPFPFALLRCLRQALFFKVGRHRSPPFSHFFLLRWPYGRGGTFFPSPRREMMGPFPLGDRRRCLPLSFCGLDSDDSHSFLLFFFCLFFPPV